MHQGLRTVKTRAVFTIVPFDAKKKRPSSNPFFRKLTAENDPSLNPKRVLNLKPHAFTATPFGA